MAILTKKAFDRLAAVHDAQCVSIFFPTSKVGKEVIEDQAPRRLKNHLKEIKTQLSDYGLSELEIGRYLQPAEDLTKDLDLWNNLSEGMAIFFNGDLFEYYTIPIKVEPFHYIADHFHLRPLLPVFNGDGRFFLLDLALHHVRLYEGSRDSIHEIYIEELTPSKMEEVVGYDYEQRFLQFRAGQSGFTGTGAMFHGHGEWQEDRKDEILQFFRAIDKGLFQLLREEDAPLVIAGVDYLYPIYKKANTYQYLFDKFIPGNTEREALPDLHQKAWKILEGHFNKIRQEKIDLFFRFSATDRTSYEMEAILPEAIRGRIDTLFIDKSTDVFGYYDQAKHRLIREEKKDISNASLTNLAAVRTFLQGGKVFLMLPEEMPVEKTVLNALYRY